MNRQLWRVLLISNFGRGGLRPLATAWFRLAVATLSSIGLGLLIAGMIWHASVPQDLPVLWVSSLVFSGTAALYNLVLLAVSSSRQQIARSGTLDRLSIVLPMRRQTRWLIVVVPQALICLLLTLFALPLVVAVAHSLAVPATPLLLALLAGVLTGLSFGTMQWPRAVWARVLLFVLLVMGLSELLQRALRATGTRWAWLPYAGFVALFGLGLAGLVYSYLAGSRADGGRGSGRIWLRLPVAVLPSGWFLLKLLRSPRMQSSLTFSVIIMLAAAIGVHVRHLGGSGDGGWLLFGGLLAAAYAADVRGTVRRLKAPEILMLKGVPFFVASQWLATIIIGLVLGLPLVIVLCLGLQNIWPVIALYCGLQTFAVAIGLFASTLLVPQEGDTGAQFFATVIATTPLLLLPRFGHLSQLSQFGQTIAWFTAALICVLLLYIIEALRSKNYGTA